jgi:hypothetical protein
VGGVDLSARVPDANRYRLALMKSAYLAACLQFGIPEGDVADQIRCDLIAARDAKDRQHVPVSALAMGRRQESTPAVDASLVRAVARLAEGPIEGFSRWPCLRVVVFATCTGKSTRCAPTVPGAPSGHRSSGGRSRDISGRNFVLVTTSLPAWAKYQVPLPT